MQLPKTCPLGLLLGGAFALSAAPAWAGDAVDGDEPLALEQDGEAVDPEGDRGKADESAEAAADAYLQGTSAHIPESGSDGPAKSARKGGAATPVHTRKAEILVPPAAPAGQMQAKSAPLPHALAVAPAASDKHAHIVSMQRALNSAGAHLTVDGVMGERTKVALIEFQKQHGLKATGEATSETLGLLGINR